MKLSSSKCSDVEMCCWNWFQPCGTFFLMYCSPCIW